MHTRGTFLSLLLFCELLLLLLASLLPHEILRRLSVALSLLLPLLLLRRAPEGTKRPALLPRTPSGYLLLLLLPAFILTVLGVSVGWGALADLIGLPLTGAVPMDSLPLALLFDALIPAVCEELFCRGAVYAALRPLGRRVAIPVSALIFALMHANPAQIPYALVAGLCLGALYEASGGLLLPILFHLASNVLSLLLMNGLPAVPTVLVLAGLTLLGGLPLLALRRRIRLSLPASGDVPPRQALRALASPALILWLLLILILTVL